MQSGVMAFDYKPCTVELYRRAVERVIVAMHERLDEPLSLLDMSRIAYISRCHFTRIFHEFTGIPPFQFLYALRLATAKHLLLTTNRSVIDVCYEVGYNSLGTFTTRFTQLVGLSPYRLRHLGDNINKLSIESFISSNHHDVQRFPPAKGFVTGRVNSPAPIEGLIFVGLFHTSIPQSRPIGGTLLHVPGAFSIGPVPDGHYYIFAVAFPRATEFIRYLLPETAGQLVGVGQSPVIVQDGIAQHHAELTLRPLQMTDPPILIALPSLLAGAPAVEAGAQAAFSSAGS